MDCNAVMKLTVGVIDAVNTPRHLKKKLLVLDVNGLLACITQSPPKNLKPDNLIRRHAILKRPFYVEFLKFCFVHFEVGIWTSRNQKNTEEVIEYLMPNMKNQLLFCWDGSYCTATHFMTLENEKNPVVFKELRKIWERCDPNLPWEKGQYNESNTLLLDDSPYKALLNPPHNSIFPFTFDPCNKNDNALAIGGDLREYLHGLSNAENVPKYVEQHPFGQIPINHTHVSWEFYRKIIASIDKNVGGQL
ncbi:unnamed protein product [Sphenostylis stenocarpa]|uniref:Mitochondrial import inner membrane translocase subunit TIM50 n=1 Tax=Sphenostylis stenocarpa TaxID=92480 RepID=A0AA86SAI1_9FABA|nr:unnamed protein product [Sphenostylis stenocarpa]